MRFFNVLLALLLGFTSISQDYNLTLISKVEFPGYVCANIWGYASGGKEYALVGVSNGMTIIDVTNPTNPVILEQLTDGINSSWREIKTYGNYAYITSEGTNSSQQGGLGIADLSGLPTVPVPFHKYHGDGPINGTLKKVHALDVDEAEGYVYLYGPDAITPKGIIVLSLISDPYNPTYAGQFTGSYVHDGYTNNGIVYGSHIYGGYFSIIDFTNKSSPSIIATQTTPNAFTHNTWLSNDGNYLFTTDEKSNSYLAAFDISDPTDIKETDRIRTTPGSGSVIHNTYIKDHFAVSSWYTDGITITDVGRPSNLIQVARYDTYSGSGYDFEGAWGVYPYLPSQNILVTNIEEPMSGGGMGGALYILAPTYQDACYLEGNVKNESTGHNLPNVFVEIDHDDPLNSATTDILGNFATGQPTPGTFDVVFSIAGFNDKTMSVSLSPGVVTEIDVELEPLALPIELVSFKAQPDGDFNLLNWETANEVQVDFFEVQRRIDMDADWEAIGTIQAVGESQAIQSYRFSDMNPLPTSYYRLKTVDLDNSFEYSEVVLVERIDHTFHLNKIYPVPSSGLFKLEIISDKDRTATLRVFNVAGHTILQNEIELNTGQNNQLFELSDEWPSGKYWVEINSNGQSLTSSVILRR